MRDTWQDVRVAWRQLRRRPGFAIVAIVTLAVGIGANTAIFSAADHVLFRPLENVDADRIVTLWEVQAPTGNEPLEVAPGNFAEWQRRATRFSAMGLAEPFGYDLTGSDGRPQSVSVWLVTDGFLEAAGIRPQPGRAFLNDEYYAGSRTVLISHRLWQSRFGGDPDLIGGTVELENGAWLVVGVLPQDLDYPEYADFWAPKTFRPREDQDRTGGYMQAVARLGPGASLSDAQQDMDRVAREMAGDFPETNGAAGVLVRPLEQHVLGNVRPALLVLMGAVGLLLLVACANVASLMLVRAMEREGELGVRVALGAGQLRLIRQLGTEAGVLAVLGGIGGLAVAWGGITALAALSPAELPRLSTIGVEPRIVLVTGLITLLTAVLCGLAPLSYATRPDIRRALVSASSGSRVRRGGRGVGAALVVGQIGMALILLIGAGLLGRSFLALRDNDLGFEVENRAAIQLFLWDQNPLEAQRIQRAQEIEQALEAVPGVEAVGIVSALPFHPSQIDAESGFSIDLRPRDPTEPLPRTYATVASPDYVQVMGIPLLQGRGFTAADREDAPLVAIINQTMADRYFAGEDPVGERITIGVMEAPASREIVGVVADVRPTSFDSEPRPELFVPFAQNATGGLTFVVKALTDAAALIPALREQIWSVDPRQSVYHAATVESLIRDTLVERRFNLVLLGGLSLIGFLLATVGVYG